MKRFPSIELNENVPIGHTLVNLYESLLLQRDIALELDTHFRFEFLDSHDDQTFLSTYFLLDSHTGIIQTLKSLDAEHWCHRDDLAWSCTNDKCGPLHFRIKATTTKTNSTLVVVTYHIYFDVFIKDANEYEPEFVDGNQTVQFNVSEEISPIKLPLGVRLARDLDCADRVSLVSYKIIWPTAESKSSSNVKVVHDVELDLLFLVVQESFDREQVEYVEFDVRIINLFLKY